MQGFKTTFQRAYVTEEEHAATLAAPEPPFTMLAVSDLLPPGAAAGFEAAGGDVL
jgi:hypothetical protein